ncbi:SH3 domain-containing protein, partial [Neobacillus jeddahensis]
MNKAMLPQGSKQIDRPWVSGKLVKKAIIPSFCFAVLSTVAFEKMVHAAPTVSTQTTVSNQVVNTTKFVNVTSGSLNVRTSASTHAAILASLTKGTAVTVLSEANGWAKVQVNGKTGYVSITYLSSSNPTSSAPSAPIKKYVNVSSGSLNLRNGASTNAAISTTLSKGTMVTVLSETNGWAKVQVNGKTGYVSSSFLSNSTSGTNTSTTTSPTTTTTKYVNITSGSLNMRNGASTSASVIVKLAKNTAVKVYSESNGWAKVQ